jgi:hypothetical protein
MARRNIVRGNIGRSVKQQAANLLETGQRFARFNQLRQRHFWSSGVFTPDANGYIAAQVLPLFVTPPGQVGQGWPIALTELETNWKSTNRIPDNQNFEVTEIGISIWAQNTASGGDESILPLADQYSVLKDTVIQIRYLTNAVPLGVAADFAEPAGPHNGRYQPQTDVAPVAPDAIVATNGFSSPGLRRRFKVPILLQHGETFSFELNISRAFLLSAGDDTDRVVVRLDFWATESFVEKS